VRRSVGVLLFLAALAALVTACGGNSSNAPALKPGRWLGAVGIDGLPLDPTMLSCCPVLSGNGSGQAIAVWGQDPLIWSNRFLPGSSWGAPLAVKSGVPGFANQPVVAMSDSGAALVIWAEEDPGNVGHVWASHGDSSAAGWSAPEMLDAGGPAESDIPPAVVAIDSFGNGIAAWWTNSALTFRYYRAGVGWAPPDRFPSKGLPALTFDAAGRAVAAWGESPSAAVVQRYEPGQGWSLLARFVPDGAGEYLPSALVFDPLGRGVIGMLKDSGAEFGPSAVAVALFDGNTWGGVSVLTDLTVRTDGPVAAISTQGGLVAWDQAKQPNGGDDVAFSTFTVGSGFGVPKVIATAPLTASVSLAMNPQGEAFAAWIQTPAQLPPTTYQVWASRYAAGAWDTPEPLQAGSANGQSPNVVADALGNALVTWVEGIGDDNGRIWANRFEVNTP
jgi:hypothetical protein